MKGIEKRIKAIEKAVKPQTESESLTFEIQFVEPDGTVSSTLIPGQGGKQDCKKPERWRSEAV